MLRSVIKFARQASPRARLVAGVWLLFFLLVICGIHGSSTGITASWWMPEKPYSAFLFNPPPQTDHQAASTNLKGRQNYLMATARYVRWDELAVTTPDALSQLAQRPRFPRINPSFGNGQNMLLTANGPVWHITTLARPATWGYFFMGAQRGLTWFWWFQPLACFTVLFLLMDVIFNAGWKFAALGAFLFCSSAYVVCWSQWPAHITFYAALACLAAYHLCASSNRRTLLISSLLLGVGLSGFAMFLYPPWQVPLAYFTLILFVALFIRDRLHLRLKAALSLRLVFFGLAVVLAAGLMTAWVVACLPDLKVMANTVYPGRRVSVGGDYSFAMIFKGIYNLFTVENDYSALKNQSEAASFYYLFPAALLALPFAPGLWRRLGIIGWAMIAYIAAALFFLLVGVPERIARLTLLSYVPGYRADLAIGLASIILTLHVGNIMGRSDGANTGRLQHWMPAIVGGGVTLFFIIHSIFLLRALGDFPPQFGLWMAFFMGAISYFLLAGRVKAFAILLVGLQLATTFTFNPLSTNLDHIYKSEMAKAITAVNNSSPERPFWVVYGGIHVGQLIAILGGRSITGIQWPPQLAIWHALDPDRRNEATYNRYAEVSFNYTSDDHEVSFGNTQEGTLIVTVSPNNPTLKALGARYVILMGDIQKTADTSRLNLIYRSSFDNFSIYEIP